MTGKKKATIDINPNPDLQKKLKEGNLQEKKEWGPIKSEVHPDGGGELTFIAKNLEFDDFSVDDGTLEQQQKDMIRYVEKEFKMFMNEMKKELKKMHKA